MGLDLMHEIAVQEPVDATDYFTLDVFPDEAFADYGFSKFVQDVPGWEVMHTVKFLPDTRTLEYAIANREAAGYAVEKISFLLGTPESCELQLQQIEALASLKRSDAWFSSGSILDRGERYRERFAIYSRPIVEKGIYYAEVGYQRKGMNENFYVDYVGQSIYVDKPRFERLEQYLWDDSNEEVRRNLRDKFLALYERGKSFLYVST